MEEDANLTSPPAKQSPITSVKAPPLKSAMISSQNPPNALMAGPIFLNLVLSGFPMM